MVRTQRGVRLAGVTLIFLFLSQTGLLRDMPHSAKCSTRPLIAGKNRGRSAAHALMHLSIRIFLIDMRQTPASQDIAFLSSRRFGYPEYQPEEPRSAGRFSRATRELIHWHVRHRRHVLEVG